MKCIEDAERVQPSASQIVLPAERLTIKSRILAAARCVPVALFIYTCYRMCETCRQ